MGCCQSQDSEQEKNIEDKIHGRRNIFQIIQMTDSLLSFPSYYPSFLILVNKQFIEK